ncbi:MAG TPA: hypothetical protein VGC79_18870 [Polyangiaceae bacterium]
MAKLVAALCPKCGANVAIDPAREVVTCNYCGTSSFVETDRRPVTQQILHHYPVIHVPPARAGGHGLLIAAIVAVAFTVLLGSAFIVYLASSRASPPAPGAPRAPGAHGTPSPFAGPLQPAAPSEEFFKDASSIPKRLSAAIGTPLKGVEMEIYPDRVALKAQDPKNPAHLDEYSYHAGEVSAPSPISMTSSELRDLGPRLFDVNAIDYGKVPFMVQDTLNVVSVEEGKVIYLFIEMGKDEPRIRVYVTGPRVSAAYAEYSFKGERRMFMK